jgi:hypothetical protein
MPTPLRDYVQHVMLEKSRGARLYRAVQAAWEEANEAYPERSRWQRKSTFRGIMWETATRKIGEISFDDSDFRVIRHRDTASFIVEDSVLLRFKHGDIELTTRNYPTTEASDFHRHDVDLYGFVGLQRVELVYVLNEFETALVWVGIAAHSEGKFLWKLELSAEGVVEVPAFLDIGSEELDTARLARLKSDQAGTRPDKKTDSGKS